MTFKPGVKLRGVRPETVAALAVAAPIMAPYGEFVVTSVMEGRHAPTSKHYIGCAFDVRTKHLKPGEAEEIAAALRAALTDEFFVLVEPDHIHVQFGKKGEVL
jgi:hypothetical protein